MSPRPAYFDKEEPLVRPLSPVPDPGRTTRQIRIQRAAIAATALQTNAAITMDHVAHRLRRISNGLESARQQEREAQRALIEAQRSSLRVAERTISILQDQIRLSEERALSALRDRLRSTALAHTTSAPMPLTEEDEEYDSDITDPDLPELTLASPLELEPSRQVVEGERDKVLQYREFTPEELLERGLCDRDGVELKFEETAVTITCGR